MVNQIAQGCVCTSSEYLQGWISQHCPGSLHPYPRVASLSLGKCFPFIQLEFSLMQFVSILSHPFLCTSGKVLPFHLNSPITSLQTADLLQHHFSSNLKDIWSKPKPKQSQMRSSNLGFHHLCFQP